MDFIRDFMNIIKVSINDVKNEGLYRFIKYHLLYLARFKVDEIKDNTIFNLLKFDPTKKSKFISTQYDEIEKAFCEANKFRLLVPSIRPAQLESEFIKFSKILRSKNIKNILEIGTAKGGTIYLFSRLANKEANIISVDLKLPKWKLDFYRMFGQSNQKIFLVEGDSHRKLTLIKVKKILKGQKLDLLFIDGDHSYKGVKSDFEMYKNLVKKGGVIAFHDIAAGYIINPEGEGVNLFWNEIKNKYKTIEIIEDKKRQFGFGIGVIFYNGKR
jgi:predicted O-methyltransferase YrrM